MADTTYWYMYLSTPTDEQVHEFILNQFEVLWDEYASARSAIPDGNLVEVSYEDLARDPVATIGHVYETLGLPGFEERVRPIVQAACDRPAAKRYQRNTFSPLPPAVREVVSRRWAKYAEAWGYRWGETQRS